MADEPLFVQSYTSADDFLARMEPLLLAQEVCYGLMLGIALNLRERLQTYGEDAPFFATVDDNTVENNTVEGSAGVVAAGLMTPPFGIILYSASSEQGTYRPALQRLAQKLVEGGWSVPTANGPAALSESFAQVWQTLTGATATVALRERIFELRAVKHPAYSSGHLRPATRDDLDIMAQWFLDFNNEALVGMNELDLATARERVQAAVARGGLYVWEDGEPVSMAGTTRPTQHGMAIGPVYTPPHWRGRGYASSCVAQLSQQVLDQGKQFCTLFTDLANPTSNHIYQNIGYRPVCDYTVYGFGVA